MRKVLMVTYALPPVGGAGVQRVSKFIKYLNCFGWEAVVLSVKNPSVPLYDSLQTRDLPENVKIFRARTFEPNYKKKGKLIANENKATIPKGISWVIKWLKNVFMILDPQILWWPGLSVSLFKILRKESCDCLFVTAPPFSSLVPVVYAGKHFGVPVVVDFRDDWRFYRLHMENAVKSPFAEMLDGVLEKFVILNCSAFTAATASYVRNLSERYGISDQRKGHVITNGFDASDFGAYQAQVNTENNDQIIRFLYSGTVWRATSLFPFFKAITGLVRAYPELRKRLQITIMGRVVDAETVSISDRWLQGITIFRGYVSHDAVVKALNTADVLIITLSDLDGADKIIPAKTFEYMATGKHILAILPHGETSRMLSAEYKNVAIFHPRETDSIAQHILNLLLGDIAVLEKMDIDVSKYERKYLTGKLADVFSSVAKNSCGNGLGNKKGKKNTGNIRCEQNAVIRKCG